MSKRVLICGCGYVGLELGRQLVAAGHTVFGLRRHAAAGPEMRAAGLTPLIGDLTQPDDLRRLPGAFDWVVNTVSSTRGGADEYRQVYLNGARQLIAWLRDAPPTRLVYTSSTSVYGQTDGQWVDETAATTPDTETGRLLVATENEFLAAADSPTLQPVVLRVAGIYGPGRGYLFQQFVRGEARLQGTGSRCLNMIHRDDVAGALSTALERGIPGQVYNVVDDEPVSQFDVLHWFAAQLGRPLPPVATAAEAAGRKRGLTDKRVSNRRLRTELGWAPRYPNFRTGYAAEVAAAQNSPAA
jgi:nucleoside-diphosphate-sugar epimerase